MRPNNNVEQNSPVSLSAVVPIGDLVTPNTDTVAPYPSKPQDNIPQQQDNLEAPEAEHPHHTEIGDVIWECAVAMLRYVQYNPKLFSVVCMTLMVILFVNYAQRIVVEVVDQAVRAHPAIQPTTELRSKATLLSMELRGFQTVALTGGRSYARRNINCWETTPDVDEFLNTMYALQTSSGTSLMLTYISYRMPDGTHWGDCGCQTVPGTDSTTTAFCSYTQQNGTMNGFWNSNFHSINATVENAYTESLDYTKTIMSFTKSEQDKGGVWHSPSIYYDVFLNKNFSLLTFTYPLAFDPVTGKCILSVSADVATIQLLPFLNLTRNTETLLVGSPKPKWNAGTMREGGRLVLDSLDGTLGGNIIYKATDTPIERINTIARIATSYVDPITWNEGIMQNVSFVADGLLYQMVTVLDTWALITRSPTSIATSEVSEALSQFLAGFRRGANTLRTTFVSAPVTCRDAADQGTVSLFLVETATMLTSFGAQVYGAYVVYPLAGQQRGACGCDLISLDFSASRKNSSTRCYYVQSNSTLVQFGDASKPSVNPTSVPFADTQRSVFSDRLASMTVDDSEGMWTQPFLYFDPENNIDINVISFVLPLSFAADGSCSSAAVVDVALTFVPQLLSSFTRGGSSDLLLVDRRGPKRLYLGSATSTFIDHVYEATATPNTTINWLMQQVQTVAGGTTPFSRSVSFYDGRTATVVNYGFAGANWGVVEVMRPEESLSRFFPAPSIATAAEVLSLLPASTNMELFQLVLGIVFLYTLNIFILGCTAVAEYPEPETPALQTPQANK